MAISNKSNLKQPYLPEVAAILSQAPDLAVWETADEIREARKTIAALFQNDKNDIISDPDLTIEDRLIPGPRGDILVSILSSKSGPSSQATRPGILHIHGGAMVVGDRFIGLDLFIPFIKEHDAVIVTVEYGLAPEHKGMELVEDCYAGLKWFAGNIHELHVDPQRLIVAGASAGGGLAAGTVLLSRDRGGPALCGQMLVCPMLDDRNDTLSVAQYEGERGTYCGAQNKKAWECVLGDQVGKYGVSVYIAPARATDLSGLPPTFVDVGGAEPFRDEAVVYALRLSQCGVLTDLHLWGGGSHGFEKTAPEAASSRSAVQAKADWFKRVVGHPQI